MFEGIVKLFKKIMKQETEVKNSKDTAKERLHLVLMQDRANVSADFLELMKQEIIEVIKKYIEVDESAIDVRLTNKNGEDGEKNGAPALYANIPILNIRNDMKKIDPTTGKSKEETEKVEKKEEATETKTEKNEEVKEEIEVKEQERTEEIKSEVKSEAITEKED